MKQIFTLLFLQVFGLAVMAQPTITTNELPVAGLAFLTGTDTSYSAPVQAGGANVTWNYSGLQNLLTDTAGFTSATGTPYAGVFPGSNLASYDIATDTWSYFTTNSSGFYANGFAGPDGSFEFSSPALYAPVPFSYGDSRVNVARLQVDTTIVDSTGTSTDFRFVLNITSTFNADGWGTVILPSGTYNDVLRVRVTEITYDSISIYFPVIGYVPLSTGASQITRFRYFQQGASASYILGIDADSLGNTADYSEYLIGSIILDVPAVASEKAKLAYPNPAVSEVILPGVHSASSGHFEVISVAGHKSMVPAVVTGDGLRLHVEGLSNGLYFYRYETGTGVQIGRFNVLH